MWTEVWKIQQLECKALMSIPSLGSLYIYGPEYTGIEEMIRNCMNAHNRLLEVEGLVYTSSRSFWKQVGYLWNESCDISNAHDFMRHADQDVDKDAKVHVYICIYHADSLQSSLYESLLSMRFDHARITFVFVSHIAPCFLKAHSSFLLSFSYTLPTDEDIAYALYRFHGSNHSFASMKAKLLFLIQYMKMTNKYDMVGLSTILTKCLEKVQDVENMQMSTFKSNLENHSFSKEEPTSTRSHGLMNYLLIASYIAAWTDPGMDDRLWSTLGSKKRKNGKDPFERKRVKRGFRKKRWMRILNGIAPLDTYGMYDADISHHIESLLASGHVRTSKDHLHDPTYHSSIGEALYIELCSRVDFPPFSVLPGH